MSLTQAKNLSAKLAKINLGSVKDLKKVQALITPGPAKRDDLVTLQFHAEQRKKIAAELVQQLEALQDKGATPDENALIANMIMTAKTELVSINRDVKAVQDKFIEQFPTQPYVQPTKNPIETALAALGEGIKAQAEITNPLVQGLKEENAEERVPKILQAFMAAKQQLSDWNANDIMISDPHYQQPTVTTLIDNVNKHFGDVENGVKAIPQAMLEKQVKLMIAIPAEFPREVKPEDKDAYIQKRQKELDAVNEVLPFITNETNRAQIKQQLESAQLALTALKDKTPLTPEKWSLNDIKASLEELGELAIPLKLNNDNIAAALMAFESSQKAFPKVTKDLQEHEKKYGKFPEGGLVMSPIEEFLSIERDFNVNLQRMNKESVDFLKQFVFENATNPAPAQDPAKPTLIELEAAKKRLDAMTSATNLLGHVAIVGTQKALAGEHKLLAEEQLENAKWAVIKMETQYIANEIESRKVKMNAAVSGFDPSQPNAAEKLAEIKKLAAEIEQLAESASGIANKNVILISKYTEDVDGYPVWQRNSTSIVTTQLELEDKVAQVETAMQKFQAKEVIALEKEIQKNLKDIDTSFQKLQSITISSEMAEPLVEMAKEMKALMENYTKAETLAKTMPDNEFAQEAMRVAKEGVDQALEQYNTPDILKTSVAGYLGHVARNVVEDSKLDNPTEEDVQTVLDNMEVVQAAYDVMRIAERSKPGSESEELQTAKKKLDEARLSAVQMEVNHNITRMAKLESDVRAAMANIDPMRREAKAEYEKLSPLLEQYKELNKRNKDLMTEHAALIKTLPEDGNAFKAKQLESQQAYEKTKKGINALHLQAQKELDRVKKANILMEVGGVLGFTDEVIYKKDAKKGLPGKGSDYDAEPTAEVSLEQGTKPRFQGKALREDEIIRSVKVHTVPDPTDPTGEKLKVTGVTVLEQDNRGTVRNFSTKNLTPEQKEEAAIRQAQMLLQNWRRGCGDIIIRGKDPAQANRVFAALLILKNEAQETNPDLKDIKIKSWVPGCSGPEKGWVSSGESDYINKHLSKGMQAQAKNVAEGTSAISTHLHNRVLEKDAIKEAYKNDKAKFQQEMDKHALKEENEKSFSVSWKK